MHELDWRDIAAIRGGVPEVCDFCGQAYEGGRYPVPEEAGEWACSECLERWANEAPHIESNAESEARQNAATDQAERLPDA